jgi:formylglycine-generating enzyme required for sulfatase activity
MLKQFISISFLLVALVGWSQSGNEMKKIQGGAFVPLYGADSSDVQIEDFYLDIYPVTNAQFVSFVKENSNWRKSKVISLFADDHYLNGWINDTTLGKEMLENSPITNVSWYVAKEYCIAQGKRLPDMDEWEYVAMASEDQKNAQNDSIFNQKIIGGYEAPRTYALPIGSTFKNYWGIYDLHGLVWEWTMDFNSVLISGESRQDVDAESSLFCAGGAVNATSLMNYAAFMRYAFRGSIKAKYCIRNQGFRCAKDESISK